MKFDATIIQIVRGASLDIRCLMTHVRHFRMAATMRCKNLLGSIKKRLSNNDSQRE